MNEPGTRRVHPNAPGPQGWMPPPPPMPPPPMPPPLLVSPMPAPPQSSLPVVGTFAFAPPEAALTGWRDQDGRPVLQLAASSSRLGARLLDALVQSGWMVVIAAAVNALGERTAAGGIVLGIGFALFLLYEPVMTAIWGGGIGKLALGLRVVRVRNPKRTPHFGMALWRWFSAIFMGYVPVLGLLNILWLLWDRPLYQCLHDKAARTVVIRKYG